MKRNPRTPLTGDQWLLVFMMTLIAIIVLGGMFVMSHADPSVVNSVMALISLGVVALSNLAAKPSFPVSLIPAGAPGATGEAGETGEKGDTGARGKAGGADAPDTEPAVNAAKVAIEAVKTAIEETTKAPAPEPNTPGDSTPKGETP